ncbi:MAG: AsmA family protein [Steroidobacteraceae bacterium]
MADHEISLRLRDLGVAFGAEPAEAAPDGDRANAAVDAAAERLLPDRDLQFERLTQVDANVDFRADAVQTVRVPLEAVTIRAKLTDGVMQLDPVVFTLPQGKLAGAITLNTRAPVPETDMDMRLSGVRLEQFKPKNAAQGPFSGMLLARAQLKGSGRSVHAVASSADGAMTAVIPRGQVREAIAELTGINLLRGLGLLLSQSDETANIRCGVAEFEVNGGRAKAERLVLDTEHVLVIGKGDIDLDEEALDLELSGKPKKLRLGRLRSPITVGGTLRHPAFGIKAEKAAAQGGIAAALGALLGPIAAALAFVDPGLEKDADCVALLAEAGVSAPPAAAR